jgi:hypothetical protein
VNDSIKRFLDQIDAALVPIADGQRLDLYHLGRSALMIGYGATFATKDIDIVQMRTPLEEQAQELFGKDSPKAMELGLYLDLVPQPLPPVANGFCRRSREVPGNWRVIRLWELEPNDLAATKIRAFRPQDRQDLQFLCDLGVLQAAKLRQSMEEAWLWEPPEGDERAEAFANLEIVIAYLEGRSRTL